MRATGGRMRHDTLLSFGGLALAPPPLSPLALDLFPVGALWPIISGCTPHAAVGGVAGPLCSLFTVEPKVVHELNKKHL